MKEDAGTAPIVVDPMGQMDGWVDPEIENMQNMIHGAIDMAFEDRNRAPEGKTSFGGTYYRGPSKAGSARVQALRAQRPPRPGAARRDEGGDRRGDEGEGPRQGDAQRRPQASGRFFCRRTVA